MPYDISYEYDAAGNRTRKVDNLTAAVTTYTYDAANQLQAEQAAGGTTTYTFDRAGNMETITTPFSDVTTYVWDGENRRTAVQTSGGSVEAAHNADGLRVRNGDTRIIWDGQAYLAETDLAGSMQTLYTVQPSRFGRLVSQKRSASMNSEWFHFDALGSTVNVSDHNQAVPERYIYDAWGNLLSSNSFKPAFLFVGEPGYYADQGIVGGYYLRARTYAPTLGIFESEDVYFSVRNAYSYAGRAPTRMVDPSGWLEILINPGRGPRNLREVPGMGWVSWPGLDNYGHVQFCAKIFGDCECCKDTFEKKTNYNGIPGSFALTLLKYGLRKIRLVFYLEIWINEDEAGRFPPGKNDAPPGLIGLYGHEQLHVKNMIKAINDSTLQKKYLAELQQAESACPFFTKEACERAYVDQRRAKAKAIIDDLYWKGFNHDVAGHPDDEQGHKPEGTMPAAPLERYPKEEVPDRASPTGMRLVLPVLNEIEAEGWACAPWHVINRTRPAGEAGAPWTPPADPP